MTFLGQVIVLIPILSPNDYSALSRWLRLHSPPRRPNYLSSRGGPNSIVPRLSPIRRAAYRCFPTDRKCRTCSPGGGSRLFDTVSN